MTKESSLWPLWPLQWMCQISFACPPDPYSSILYPALCPGGWDIIKSKVHNFWLGIAMRISGRKWKEGGEWGQVFISLTPFLRGYLKLVLPSRRSTLSLKGLCKSLLDFLLFSLQAKGTLTPQLLLCLELLHSLLWFPYTHPFVSKIFSGYPI